jgi:hypothetical protein
MRDVFEDRANEAAKFFPVLGDDQLPAVQVAGVMVFVYVKDGELHVSAHYDEADPSIFPFCDTEGVRTVTSGL